MFSSVKINQRPEWRVQRQQAGCFSPSEREAMCLSLSTAKTAQSQSMHNSHPPLQSPPLQLSNCIMQFSGTISATKHFSNIQARHSTRSTTRLPCHALIHGYQRSTKHKHTLSYSISSQKYSHTDVCMYSTSVLLQSVVLSE